MSLIRRISGDFRHLCKPAMVYLAISVVVLVSVAYQNMGLSNMYCMGDFSCYVPSTAAVIFSEALYILFWTWILHLMCRTGYASISWLLVVFPLVLFFVLIGLMMIASMQMTRQGRVQRMRPIERVREGFSRSEQMQQMRKKMQIMRERYPANSEKRKRFEEEYKQFVRSAEQDDPIPMQIDPMQSDLMQSDPMQIELMQSDLMQSDPMQSDPMQSDPMQVTLMQSDPVQYVSEGYRGGNSHGPPNMRPR